MNQYYYIDNQGKQAGPIDPEVAIKYSIITPSTMVWCAGMADWSQATNVEELIDIFKANGLPNIPQPHAPQTPPQAPQMPAAESATTPAPAPDNLVQPSSNMVFAILTTCLCCLPFGIVAIVYASKVDGCWFSGQYDEAYYYSKKAHNWSMASLITGLVVVVLYIIFVAILGAAATHEATRGYYY